MTPWTAAHQASLTFTISWSLLKLMSTESMMASNHLILYHFLFLLSSVVPSIRVFSNGRFFTSGGQSIRASSSVLPMDIRAPLVAQMVKNPPAMQEAWVRSLGWEDAQKESMATHSGILAWTIPMDRGAWWATVHGVTKSQTQLSD